MKRLPALRALAVAALASGAQLTWAAEEVQLQFAWPDGLRATVRQTKSRTTQPALAATPAAELTFIYSMRAAKAGGGTTVSFGKFALAGNLAAAMSVAERAQLEMFTQAGLPSIRISDSGEFLGIHDLAGFQSSVRAVLKAAPFGSRDEANVDRAIEQVTSESVLQALAANDWNLIVGNWAGSKLEPGATYRATYSAPLPVFSGPSVAMVSRFSIVRTLPCTRSGVTRDCVELEMNTTPDPAGLADAIKNMMKGMVSDAAAKIEDLNLKDLDVRTSVRLVTEASTLVPHSYTSSKVVRMTVTQAGQDMTSSQEEKAAVTYTYDGQ